jgi:hypothetical protein
MAYRVRTPDGELSFASLYDIERAYAQGLVDAGDEVQEDGSSAWRKVSAIPALRQTRPVRPERPAAGLSPGLLAVTLICAGVALQQLFFGNRIVALTLCLCAGSLATGLTYRAFKKK